MTIREDGISMFKEDIINGTAAENERTLNHVSKRLLIKLFAYAFTECRQNHQNGGVHQF